MLSTLIKYRMSPFLSLSLSQGKIFMAPLTHILGGLLTNKFWKRYMSASQFHESEREGKEREREREKGVKMFPGQISFRILLPSGGHVFILSEEGSKVKTSFATPLFNIGE